MKTKSTTQVNYGLVAAVLVAALVMLLLFVPRTNAAALAQVLVRFDRMKVSTATTGTVCANPTTVATEADVKVTFPTGYTVSSTAGNWTVNTTNTAWPSGAAAWPGINTATTASGQDVTFPSSDLTVGTLYCFNWTNSAALTVKAGATSSNLGVVTTEATGPSTIDSAQYATASIADDQIVVTATVPQAFSFALSGNTDALGTLSTGSISSSPTPRTATVNTNAKNGWLVWAKDSNTGLNSATASATIASTTPGTNSTLSAGTAGYNTGVTQTQAGGTGTVTVATPFVGGVSGKGGGLDTSFRTLASSNGTADTAVLTLTNNATIAATTPAATDYTDTITVVGAGLF
ncbi:hypothetical protein KDA23_04115 [Candidatus Saccharibacteria bacterium]|nr:hypothetical protein [Candidatus Saccharibacteria bacterium]